jgi:hypothetical protein
VSPWGNVSNYCAWRFAQILNEESVATEMAKGSSPDVKNKAGAKNFSCEVCGKLMHHWKSLDLHMKIHSGETQCHLCHKVLNRSYALKLHLFKVHGISSQLHTNM